MNQDKIKEEIERLKSDVNYQKFDRISKYSRYVSIAFMAILFIIIVVGSLRLNILYKDIAYLEDVKRNEILKIDALKFENISLEKKKNELEKELMTTYGLSIDSIKNLSTSKVLEISLKANEAIKTLLNKYIPSRNVSVYYYNKTIDEKRVATELQALGYKFVVKPPASYMSKYATNAIWFGSGVSINDVKIVSLAMIRAGIPIKGIRPFRNSSNNNDYKKYIIEVGASVDLENYPNLTVDEVINKNRFER